MTTVLLLEVGDGADDCCGVVGEDGLCEIVIVPVVLDDAFAVGFPDVVVGIDTPGGITGFNVVV